MPSPSHPHTTERIAVAREAHWSNVDALRFLAEVRECAAAGDDVFRTEAEMYGRGKSKEVDRG